MVVRYWSTTLQLTFGSSFSFWEKTVPCNPRTLKPKAPAISFHRKTVAAHFHEEVEQYATDKKTTQLQQMPFLFHTCDNSRFSLQTWKPMWTQSKYSNANKPQNIQGTLKVDQVWTRLLVRVSSLRIVGLDHFHVIFLQMLGSLTYVIIGHIQSIHLY